MDFQEDFDYEPEDENSDEDWIAPEDVTGTPETASYVVQIPRECYRPSVVTNEETLTLQIVDIDSYEYNSDSFIRMFGITLTGQCHVVKVMKFRHYFFLRVPPFLCSLADQVIESMIESSCTQILNVLVPIRQRPRQLMKTIHSVHLCSRDTQSIYYYDPDFRCSIAQTGVAPRYVKITLNHPRYVRLLTQYMYTHGIVFHQHGVVNGKELQFFESNVPYVLRAMIDLKIRGGSWVTVPNNANGQCLYTQVIAHDIQVMNTIGPLRILSFDIECCAQENRFPKPELDPIIQISAVCHVYGESKHLARFLFTLGKCAPITRPTPPDPITQCFSNEKDMMLAFTHLVCVYDPDVMTGHNITNFDFPYLMNRAQVLGIKPQFSKFSRVANFSVQVKAEMMRSNQSGARETHRITIPGRNIFDMMLILRQGWKLRSYSLGQVSCHFLNQTKEDVDPKFIPILFHGSEQDVQRLGSYCLKDAELPIQLMNVLHVIPNFIEMARVTGVPISFLLTRGQQVKVMNQIYRHTHASGCLLVPHIWKPMIHATSGRKSSKKTKVSEAAEDSIQDWDDDSFEGATVIEPKVGYYKDPIATLDFASLYPSIMIANNLCYSSYLPKEYYQYFSSDELESQFTTSPNGHKFAKKHLTKGILPTILENLLASRKAARNDLKKATDPLLIAVLDGRQLALKVSANSVYGFTGATTAPLYLKAIAETVTSFGRAMIELSKQTVEEHYTTANGYRHNAVVVYGDTDSVMCLFGTSDLSECMQLGKEAAERITQKFQTPIKLEFEKCYYPYLLVNKKRYAGMYWTKTSEPDKMDVKGLETVRRDACLLVNQTLDMCLRTLLIDKSVEKAVAYVHQVVQDLFQGTIDVHLLVLSRGLSRPLNEYKTVTFLTGLIARRQQRNPEWKPSVGDRLPFVIIAGHKHSKAHERSEDPKYVIDNDLPIDADFYFDSLKQPLLRIFKAVDANPESLLFSGRHMLSRYKPISKTGPMARFLQKRPQCLLCQVTLVDTENFCQYCLTSAGPQIEQMKIEKKEQYQKVSLQYAEIWKGCQECQGSHDAAVICTSLDCPKFYKRIQLKKLKEKLESTVDQLRIVDIEDIV